MLPASDFAAWVYLVPLTALVWAALILDERLTVFVVVGGVMVIAGVVLTERVAARSEAEASAPYPKNTSAIR